MDFSDLLENVLNSNFVVFLPDAFKRVTAKPTPPPNAVAPAEQNVGRKRKAEEPGGDNNAKKGKVKNSQQDSDFKPREGESWATTFAAKLNKDRPTWSENVKMCARWFIKGDCFDKCDKHTSHVPKDQVPADRKADFLAFMDKCRATTNAN